MRDGAVYEGEFKNDEITGKGKIRYVIYFYSAKWRLL
jgi:hypothetical protein